MSSGGDGQIFHATAQANLDNDATSQIWHYRNGDLASKTHVGQSPLSCTDSAGRAKVVEPCDSQSGISVF